MAWRGADRPIGQTRGRLHFRRRALGIGGRGGIRTHGTVSRTPVFKTGALNHSATLPKTIRRCWQGDPALPHASAARRTTPLYGAARHVVNGAHRAGQCSSFRPAAPALITRIPGGAGAGEGARPATSRLELSHRKMALQSEGSHPTKSPRRCAQHRQGLRVPQPGNTASSFGVTAIQSYASANAIRLEHSTAKLAAVRARKPPET